jgi:hypothetical protein
MSAKIIGDAKDERANYGDKSFFRRLNAGVGNSKGGWVDLEASWDANSFVAAADASPQSEAHLRLVSDLLRTVATLYVDVISSRSGNFVRFKYRSQIH